MSGYRQSSYDLEAYEQLGRPLTPYNWVQWTGVALGTLGVGLFLLYYAGRLGLTAEIVDNGSAEVSLDGGQLSPGESVIVRLGRESGNVLDTCDAPAVVTGMVVSY